VKQVFVAALALLASAAPAAAQQAVQFIPNYDFHLDAALLSGDDRRFEWDANFGGEIDVVDYGIGRFTFWANYNVVMGDQIREFDPNQGNYVLAGSTSARVAAFELAGVFYHQSRHLSDRPKLVAVDWNMIGGRIIRDVNVGRARWHAVVDLRKTIERSLVDYERELESGLRGRFMARPHVGVISALGVRVLGVDGSRDRGTQTGYLAEGGVRFEGVAGAMEFFVAAERRIDPYPLEFGTITWAKAGFRLLSR
jgi:hypothetical protein